MSTNEDKFILGGHEFTSRFILGSGKFSLDLVKACIEKAEAQIITLALRRANEGGLANILDYIPDNVTLLPNTSGARNAEEAVRIARLSREVGCGDFVKIEVVHDFSVPAAMPEVRQRETARPNSPAPLPASKRMIPNTCFRTTTKPSKQQKSLQKKALLSCRICTRI